MPTKVTGADGRVLHDNLDDHDAADLARRVHANTGEPVTLTPLVWDEESGEYAADDAAARILGAESSEPEAAADEAVAEAEPDPTPEVEPAAEPEAEPAIEPEPEPGA